MNDTTMECFSEDECSSDDDEDDYDDGILEVNDTSDVGNAVSIVGNKSKLMLPFNIASNKNLAELEKITKIADYLESLSITMVPCTDKKWSF